MGTEKAKIPPPRPKVEELVPLRLMNFISNEKEIKTKLDTPDT